MHGGWNGFLQAAHLIDPSLPQESAAGQAAGPSHAPPVSGADMMEDVILETLLREHMVRFAQKGAAEAASREMGDQAHGEDKKGR